MGQVRQGVYSHKTHQVEREVSAEVVFRTNIGNISLVFVVAVLQQIINGNNEGIFRRGPTIWLDVRPLRFPDKLQPTQETRLCESSGIAAERQEKIQSWSGCWGMSWRRDISWLRI